MRLKDTNESFDKKLLDKGINHTRIGEYTRAIDKIEFKCYMCEHIWSSTPANISRGQGCPKCAGNIKDTNESFDLKLENKNINYIRNGSYIDSKTPIEFQCPKCLYLWYASPTSIIGGSGCPSCYGNIKYTNESFDLKLLEKGIKYTRLEEYCGNKTKLKFFCPKCSHIWQVTPDNILRGSGCPSCAITGFNTSKPAYLYFIQISNFLKVGITNREPSKRYKELTDKEVIEIKVIEGLGSSIRELEQKIHNNFKHYYPEEKLKSGNTECFHIELKENILGMLA